MMAMRDGAMILLLRRMLKDAVIFCAFEKVRERVTFEKWHRYR
jgi:hypothetical protein